jgi:hypothetical protein
MIEGKTDHAENKLTIEFMSKEQADHGIHDRGTENKRTMEFMIKEQIAMESMINEQIVNKDSEQRTNLKH